MSQPSVQSSTSQDLKHASQKDSSESHADNTKGKENDVSSEYREAVSPGSSLFQPTTKSIGIRKAEILNKQYNTWVHKVCLYVSVFFISYAYAVDGTLKGYLQAYVTNSYAQHSLLSTINVVRGVISAAAQPAFARLSDRFGRLEMIIVSIIFYSMGTVIESQAYDVNRFAAGVAIYNVGYSGIVIMMQLVVADFSNLNWRLVCSMIPALPFIINTWVTSEMFVSMYPRYSWNYCIGIWAFIFPLSCVPLIACFIHMHMLARRTPEWKLINEEYKKTHQSFWTITKSLFWELDVVGILFIICVFGFILVPLTLAGGVSASAITTAEDPADKWRQAKVIAPLVVGFVLIPFFGLWEAKYSRFPIVPFKLLKDRGVWAAICIGVLINWVWYMPNDFMYTVLIVGMRASQRAASRITTLYSFVSVISGPLLGLVVTRFRRLKGFIIFGTVCWVVSMGLLVHFRGDNDGVNSQLYQNGVIGALCLMGFGAGFFTYPTQVSISTCTNHEYMGIVISLYLASYNIGSALGSSVSGAVWTNLMYNHILRHMESLGVDGTLATMAYQTPLTFIITYVWGTPERIAVVLAYADVQRVMCIVGLVLCFPLLLFACFLRDHKLESVQSLNKAGEVDTRDIEKDETVLNDNDDDLFFKTVSQFISNLFKRK